MKKTITEEELEESFSVKDLKHEGGKFYLTARSLSKDFECEDGLKALANDSINKHYIWRHQHPMQEGNVETHVYGKVVDSKYENGYIVSKYELYDHTSDHIALIDLIKERFEAEEPLGVSMHYRKYVDKKNEKVIHYDVYEHSGTPFPACEDCKTINYGIKTMANEDKKSEKDEEKNEAKSKTKDKIKELEELLNSKSEKLESYEDKIETLEKELESEQEEKMTLEEKVDNMGKQIKQLEKKPYIDKIYELEQDEDLIDFYKSKDVKFLQKRFEKVEKEVEERAVMVEEMEKSAGKSNVTDDEELEEKEPELKEFLKDV